MKKLIMIMCTALFLLSCNDMTTIRPSGNITRENRPVKSFLSVSVCGDIKLVVGKDTIPRVVVETQQNLHDFIEVNFIPRGNSIGILNIRVKPDYKLGGKSKVTVYVASDSILNICACENAKVEFTEGFSFSRLRLSGGEGAKFIGGIKGDSLAVDLSDNSEAQLDTQCKSSLIINGSGGSSFELSGKTAYMSLDLSQGSKLDACGLGVNSLEANLTQKSHAVITVESLLIAFIDYTSQLIYNGNPDVGIVDESSQPVNQICW